MDGVFVAAGFGGLFDRRAGCSGAEPQPLKVALVFDIGGRRDGGFNDSAYSGLEKAVAVLGVKAVYVEHKRNLELDQALNQAAASDAGMIIGVGFAFSEQYRRMRAKWVTPTVDFDKTQREKITSVVCPCGSVANDGGEMRGGLCALRGNHGE